MKYLWTEDTGAGLHFWKLVNQLFFNDALVVESKESNQGLLDALSDIDMKEDDKYYIAFDYVVDNQDIRNKYWVNLIIYGCPTYQELVKASFVVLMLIHMFQGAWACFQEKNS